jgi:hypothetical protein
MVLALCSQFAKAPRTSLPFFKHGGLKALLLYREPSIDDFTPLNNVATAHENCRNGVNMNINTVVRLSVLQFLEQLAAGPSCDDEDLKDSLHDLTLCIMACLVDTSRICPLPMVGSEAFGTMLRCWQALCVLSGHMCMETATILADVKSGVGVVVYPAGPRGHRTGRGSYQGDSAVQRSVGCGAHG